MRKLFIMTALAVVSLAFASTANAYTVSPGGAIRASAITLRFTGPLGATMSCDVVLTGTIATSGNINDSIGAVTTSSLANCTRDATVLVSPGSPWNIRLISVLGNPINGALLLIEGVSFEVRNLPIIGTCLYSGNIGALAGPNPATALTVLTNSLPRVSGGSLCGTGSINAGQSFTLDSAQTIS